MRKASKSLMIRVAQVTSDSEEDLFEGEHDLGRCLRLLGRQYGSDGAEGVVVELHELADTALRMHGEFRPAFRAMILFAAYVGLRPGELFALERGDLAEDEVHIRRNLDGTGQLKLPKNEAVAAVEAFLADLDLRIEAITEAIARAAARLRSGSRRVRLPDALVIATADEIEAEKVLTGDASWAGISRRVTLVRSH